VTQGVTREQWRSRAATTDAEAEADALWDEYYALADQIDGLRWWNRWRRESDLRSRLRKNGLQRAALDDRRSVPDVIGEQKAM